MVPGLIYLRQRDGSLVNMTEEPYDTEAVLQQLLADHPSILAGEQVSALSPRRWLLVGREAPVPSAEGGGNRWAIDHLFLDQDGIPTVVEVKRSVDTRIRREVVGQMLDYAANAVVYWPADHIRRQFQIRCASNGLESGERILEALGRDDEEVFWQSVETNLLAGNIRMIFVADEIPPELRRVIEFLNDQMSPAEVLALEVRQYVGQGLQVLVPRVIGQTERASPTRHRSWVAVTQSNLNEIVDRAWAGEDATLARAIVMWANDRNVAVQWRNGKYAGLGFRAISGRTGMLLFSYKTVDQLTVEMLGTFTSTLQPFDSESSRIALIDRLNAIPGVRIGRDQTRGFPGFNRTLLHDPSVRQSFLDVFDGVLDELRQHE